MFERNARPHAGMAEEIITNGQRKFERSQEPKMLLRHRSPQRAGCFLESLPDHDRGNWNSVGVEGFEPTKSSPAGRDGWIAQKHLEQLLVIAFEPDVLGRKGIAFQPFEHPARIWTSVHVVAQRYGQAVSCRICLEISLDFLDHSIEQV